MFFGDENFPVSEIKRLKARPLSQGNAGQEQETHIPIDQKNKMP